MAPKIIVSGPKPWHELTDDEKNEVVFRSMTCYGVAYFIDGHQEPILNFIQNISDFDIVFYTPSGKYGYRKRTALEYEFARSITRLASISYFGHCEYEEDWVYAPIERIEIKKEYLEEVNQGR